jgi:hypothetical protein
VVKASLGPPERIDAPAPLQEVVDESKSAWYTNPPYPVVPRAGNFYVPPTGCGYYSLADMVFDRPLAAPPKSGYPPFALMPPPLYDADFRYVDDPNYTPDFFEKLHRIHLGNDWLFGTGGTAWWRSMQETNSRLSGKDNVYDLYRVRAFGDLWYRDTFRIYAEMINADTTHQQLPQRVTDMDSLDFQNLFIDVKIGEIDCHPVYLRAGRQEIYLGSQRLVSALDWANTRRTFQGVRGLWSNDNWDVTAFWLQPVIPDVHGWSSVDSHQDFYGAWATYRQRPGTALDVYWLFLDNSNHATTVGLITAPTSVHTLGARYAGDYHGFLWDGEAMLQLGTENGKELRAGAATAGVGYNWKDVPMNPTVWLYYDWASGDHSPNSGDYTTFNQLFPFNHYYFGMMDLVGRQNIRDWSAQFYVNPARWITVNAQWHFLSLDAARDALYNSSGVPYRISPKGTAGGDVGQMFTVITNFHLTNRTDFFVGYSKLDTGDFIRNTGNASSGRNSELFYMMYNIRW